MPSAKMKLERRNPVGSLLDLALRGLAVSEIKFRPGFAGP